MPTCANWLEVSQVSAEPVANMSSLGRAASLARRDSPRGKNKERRVADAVKEGDENRKNDLNIRQFSSSDAVVRSKNKIVLNIVTGKELKTVYFDPKSCLEKVMHQPLMYNLLKTSYNT